MKEWGPEKNVLTKTDEPKHTHILQAELGPRRYGGGIVDEAKAFDRLRRLLRCSIAGSSQV